MEWITGKGRLIQLDSGVIYAIPDRDAHYVPRIGDVVAIGPNTGRVTATERVTGHFARWTPDALWIFASKPAQLQALLTMFS